MKKVLIVGVGSIGERHLRCFLATGRAEVFVCESNGSLGEKISEKYACPWFDSMESAMAKVSFDAAVICTPAPTHIPIASTCLQKGLHVLIEKPLAVSLEGIEEFLQQARSADRVVRVAYIHRSIAQYISLKKLLGDGVTGPPRHVTIASGQNFPTFRPAYREIYYARHASGGGAIQDALTHIVNTVEWLIAPIKTVYAMADRMVLDGVEVEDTVNLVARLQNGALVSFALNQFQVPNESKLYIHGAKGSITFESLNCRVGRMLKGDSDWQWTPIPTEERDAGFIRQANAFLNATEGKEDSLATLEEAIQTLKVNLAALESVRTGKEITL